MTTNCCRCQVTEGAAIRQNSSVGDTQHNVPLSARLHLPDDSPRKERR